MDKQTARMVVQRRIDSLPQDISDVPIIREVTTLLNHVLAQYSQARVLAYRSEQEWREVDLTPLITMFPNFQFTVAPVAKSKPKPVGQFEVVLVPLYGFNTQGFRLGHGGGWYDRFLASQEHIVKIGVGHEIGRVDFPTEAHDIAMDYIVTEKGAVLL